MSFSKDRKIIEARIFSLQDKVANALLDNPDVDKFLDNTTLLDEWEEIKKGNMGVSIIFVALIVMVGLIVYKVI